MFGKIFARLARKVRLVLPLPAGTDLLASPETRVFFLELTSRCNLRCVYCAVSQPSYSGADLDIADLGSLISDLKLRRVRTLAVNGHGETTMIPGWHQTIEKLADAGFELSIITNLARLLSEEELAAMARIKNIQISVDTHRPDVLRKVRRHVSLSNILRNMAAIADVAARKGFHPIFVWSCVVSDQVAFDLVEYIRFGLANGVRDFTLCNLTRYDDVEGADNVEHVSTLPPDRIRDFLKLLDEGKALVKEAGGNLTIQDGLTDALAMAQAREAA